MVRGKTPLSLPRQTYPSGRDILISDRHAEVDNVALHRLRDLVLHTQLSTNGIAWQELNTVGTHSRKIWIMLINRLRWN